jgi:peptidoglycan hydrolase CwlO-like protein
MVGTRVEIAMRHITEQQKKIKEHEARVEALQQAGHLSEVELEFKQKLMKRLRAYQHTLETCPLSPSGRGSG